MSTQDVTILIERLSIKEERGGIIDAIRAMILAAGLEEIEGILGGALHFVSEERRARIGTVVATGWRCG